MKTRVGIIISLAVFLSLFTGLAVTYADDFSVAFTPNGAATCDGNGFTIPIHISYNLPDNLAVLPATEVNILNGVTIFSGEDDFGYSGSASFDSSEVEGAGSGFPTALPYSYQRIFTFMLNNTPISQITFAFDCDAGGHFLNEIVSSVQFGTGPGNVSIPAPPLPTGFVLRIITCDTPLFDRAGGQPVAGGAHITAGQTWYINPKPANSADGASWTELFAGGYSNGFVPSACIGGAPAGWTGA